MMSSSFIKKTALALLSVSSAATASAFGLEKRYGNNTCVIETTTSTAVVDVWGPAYTGVPSNQYTAPAMESVWSSSEGPVFTIYVPQDGLNGLELIADDLQGLDFDQDSYTMYTGDVGNFIYPGEIYSALNDGLIFKGKTQDPLLKIVAAGKYDKSAPVFIAVFELDLDLASTSALKKRDTKVVTLSASLDNPLYTSAVSSTASTSSATATTDTASSGATATATDATSTATATDAAGATGAETTANATAAPAAGATTSADSGTTADNGSDSGSGSHSDSDSGVTTIVTGSTVIKTITSCSDNKCNAAAQTGVENIVVKTIDSVVTTYTEFCPQAIGGGVPATVVSVDTTVTVGSVVTEINTYCPVVEGAAVTTLSADTVTTVVTFTQLTNVPSAAPAPSATATVPAPSTSVPVEEQQSTLTTVANPSSPSASVSIYQGAAAAKSSNFLAGGFLGLVGMLLML